MDWFGYLGFASDTSGDKMPGNAILNETWIGLDLANRWNGAIEMCSILLDSTRHYVRLRSQ
jgi:hypothetical protein